MITTANTSQTTQQAADGMMHSADRALDSTRNYANHALDVAGSKMHSMHDSVEPALAKLSNGAEQLAQQAMDIATQARDKTRESLANYSAATTRYVSEKPMQSVLIAAAVGAVVALLVSSTRHRNHY